MFIKKNNRIKANNVVNKSLHSNHDFLFTEIMKRIENNENSGWERRNEDVPFLGWMGGWHHKTFRVLIKISTHIMKTHRHVNFRRCAKWRKLNFRLLLFCCRYFNIPMYDWSRVVCFEHTNTYTFIHTVLLLYMCCCH